MGRATFLQGSSRLKQRSGPYLNGRVVPGLPRPHRSLLFPDTLPPHLLGQSSCPWLAPASTAPNAATSRPMPWEVCTSEPGMTAARAQPGRGVPPGMNGHLRHLLSACSLCQVSPPGLGLQGPELGPFLPHLYKWMPKAW